MMFYDRKKFNRIKCNIIIKRQTKIIKNKGMSASRIFGFKELNANMLVIIGLILLVIIIILKSYTSIRESIENFESSLSNLSNNKKKKEKQKIINRLKFANVSGDKKTLDDLINDVASLDLDKANPYNMKDELVEYINSFSKGKISKKSNNTAEALDKYKLFKEKFFEIFD